MSPFRRHDIGDPFAALLEFSELLLQLTDFIAQGFDLCVGTHQESF